MDFFPDVVSIVLLRDDDLVTGESLSDIWKEIISFMSTVNKSKSNIVQMYSFGYTSEFFYLNSISRAFFYPLSAENLAG